MDGGRWCLEEALVGGGGSGDCIGWGARVVVVVIVFVLGKSCIGCMGYTRMMGGGSSSGCHAMI